MAKVTVSWKDAGLQAMLKNLQADSGMSKTFYRRAFRRATEAGKKLAKAASISQGYPTAPGTRMTQGAKKSKPYQVWGRVPGALRAGKFVPKRSDDGDVSQRVIVGAKRRGTTVGAPHANITRYSKNVDRKTKKGYNRGKFAPIPFIASVIPRAQVALRLAIREEYSRYARLVQRGK